MKSKAFLLLTIFLFSIVPLSNASANGSSDVMLTRPEYLSCVSDPILECAYPIDATLSHSWPIKAYNADVAEEYAFRMTVVNSSTNAQVHSASNTVTMAAYDVVAMWSFITCMNTKSRGSHGHPNCVLLSFRTKYTMRPS